MRRVLILAITLLVLFQPMAEASEPEDWRREFDRICALTGEAGSLSGSELEALITQSEDLESVIEKSGEPDSRVYMFRLRKCRDFFIFMKNSAAAVAE